MFGKALHIDMVDRVIATEQIEINALAFAERFAA
jgi:hypothetical protein